MGLWDAHGPQFIVPALLLVLDCDHSTPDVVAGFQDQNLGSGEAVIPGARLSLPPPGTPSQPQALIWNPSRITQLRGWGSSRRVLGKVSEAEELLGGRGQSATWSVPVSRPLLDFCFHENRDYG